MPTSRQLARRAARVLIAEFLATQIPEDHSGPEVCFDHTSDLDLAFIDFWRAKDVEHAATCSVRSVHGNCTECDALQLLHLGPITGVSTLLHEQLLEMGRFEAFGEMTLPVCLMRPSMAV